MYKQWFFLALNVCILSAGAAPCCNRPELSNDHIFPREKPSPDVVRVFSYNIRGDSAIDTRHGNAWEARRDKIHYLVQQYDPDIIGLQEVSKRYMPDLKQLFSCYIPIVFDATNDNHDAVLFVRTDRFAIKDYHNFYLSGDPSGKNFTQQPGYSAKPRIAVYVTLFDYQTHKASVVCCAHFESRGMESRINNARILTQQLAKEASTTPLILVGDFNFFVGTSIYAEKSRKAYELITQGLLMHDVRDLSGGRHYGPDGTWIGWPYDKYAVSLGAVGERLDGIFVRKWGVLQEGVLNLKVKSSEFIKPFEKGFNAMLYPSDHLPIIADVLVQ